MKSVGVTLSWLVEAVERERDGEGERERRIKLKSHISSVIGIHDSRANSAPPRKCERVCVCARAGFFLDVCAKGRAVITRGADKAAASYRSSSAKLAK